MFISAPQDPGDVWDWGWGADHAGGGRPRKEGELQVHQIYDVKTEDESDHLISSI